MWSEKSPNGGVAQLGEHLLCKQGVIGSIPFTSTIASEVRSAYLARCMSMVSHHWKIQKEDDNTKRMSVCFVLGVFA
jgi:hypothetical protein